MRTFKNRKKVAIAFSLVAVSFFYSCKKDDSTDDNTNGGGDECTSDQTIDQSRGACNETLAFTPQFSETQNGPDRVITANSIPNHKVGTYGNGMGSLGPNTISEQNEIYRVPLQPQEAASWTSLLNTSSTNGGPEYSFGVLLNGVELDPVAAEPFPHTDIMDPDVNWEWNLEATNINIGLDCNNAHVQPTGKYHYHGSPTLYLQSVNAPGDEMTLVGYAADGFPIYYKYAYSDANDANSTVTAMSSSYQLKSGDRPGDGVTAPCGTYDGVYSNDYEYVSGLGTLDEGNGRNGVTPEYPGGTYYYIITDEFPAVPRYLRGTPSDDFLIQPGK